jgi:hypothetical protein
MLGFIGVRPPNSFSLKDISNWIGKEPTFVASGTNLVVQLNGTGLRGNKWMAGRKAITGTGLTGHSIGGLELAYGGFIATEDGWCDGVQIEDRNDHLVDIGKYISVVGAYGVMSNTSSSTAYIASSAALYAGFVSSLDSKDGPTNSVIPGTRLPFRISVSKLDSLAGYRYVMLQDKAKGTVVADAPTASRPDSDYTRLTTIRIVKDVLDSVRAVADPFLGKSLSGAKFAALDTAISQALAKMQAGQYISRYDKSLSATAIEKVQGKCNLELVLVPAYELRRLYIYVALAAQ